MSDQFDKKTRSRMMASVKSKNTAPELKLRKALFAKGFRYRLHNKILPGSPDLVFPKYKAVIFVHGCFWHNHDCKYGKLPEDNHDFWKHKLQGNASRDALNIVKLQSLGWKVKIVWSCDLKNKHALEKISVEVVDWLNLPNFN